MLNYAIRPVVAVTAALNVQRFLTEVVTLPTDPQLLHRSTFLCQNQISGERIELRPCKKISIVKSHCEQKSPSRF